jgi:flagellar biosynthetic protein FlhB
VAEQQEAASKTEEPTQRKLDDARNKGDVAKTMDLPAFLALAGSAGVLILAGGGLSRGLAEALLPFFTQAHAFRLEDGGGALVARLAMLAAAPILLCVFLAAGFAGAAGNLVQHGFLWTGAKLKPEWSKVSPLAGFKRIFGVDGLVQFFKSLFKLLIIGAVAWAVVKPHTREFETLAALDPAAMLPLSRDLLVGLFGGVLTALAVGAALDWIWQRHRFMQRMRMTREEVKDDYKQSEGDPHVKARLKQIRAERSKRRMMQNLPKATLVVTNPTHYAVALRYEAGETAAPVCVAKGMDKLALRIREVAAEHGVPIIEDPPLARALHKQVDVDEVIPREHFEAVAKIIGFVMNRGRTPPPARPRPAR